MRVCQSLICCLVLILQDRASLVDAQINSYLTSEGEDITVLCFLTFEGNRRLFCKEPCEDENILIDTDKDEDQSGRYSIKCERVNFRLTVLYVTITKLKKSDSGLYRCVIREGLSLESEDKFKIIVNEASETSAPKGTVEFSPTTQTSTVVTTTTAAEKSLNSTASSHQTKDENTKSGVRALSPPPATGGSHHQNANTLRLPAVLLCLSMLWPKILESFVALQL
ncbi:hypothetical protein OJAV_G00070930 [Oryzias javanicus]|uniref:Immunoglobulin V-set domain-containing protein n=1 Tax=Oryzias javanicus TaxID=123683 RepID=A0A3S2N0L0_ORYJA|nr:hypothetical protein OJAV_G00070930 [Oryzias javanicus]